MASSITISQLQRESIATRQLVDVRSHSEFAVGHIPGALNIPLDQIESRLEDLSKTSRIVLVCQMGKRAQIAANLLQSCGRPLEVLEGGTNAWSQAGLPLVASVKTRWSLERQVRLGAGLLVLTGIVLSIAVNPHWLYLSAFVGLGLTFAGVTDFCPMAEILGKMPWNTRSHCKTPAPNIGNVSDAK